MEGVVHQSIEEALGEYCKRFSEQSPNELVQKWGGYDAKQPHAPADADVIQAKLQLEMDLHKDTPKLVIQKGIGLCEKCKLPLGSCAYFREGGNGSGFHAECLAQLMVHDLSDEEQERRDDASAQKNQQREEYGIGWKADHIPRNAEAASKLAMEEVPQGMLCVVCDEAANSICLAATTDPSAAITLEYLSTALQVRRTEGHEPIFSLDPVDDDDHTSMQTKAFKPEWLAGTSAGEVLFQADYHLKELSMGEFEQPVVGMKSCFDYSEIDERLGWSAREWFLVRKAEVQISECDVLIPTVKMGVEAREQVMSGDSLEDKPLTRTDHPMVKYAEAFTKNFDLIAERKSVVYHLRELAKASVIAKFLLDSNMELEECWFNLAANKEFACSLEVPQLWNERVRSEVHVKDDGEILDEKVMHGVYGGVQFGLDKFSLSTSVARQASVQAGLSQHRLAFGLSRRAGLAPASYIQSMASGAHFAPPSAALSAAAVRPARLGAPSAALSAASITGAPRLATSIGVTPLASKLPPPSATLSATVAPRLATSIGVTKLTPLSAKFAPPSAALSATVAPRLATSVGSGVGMARAPSLSAKFAPPSATLSSTVAPRLATSVGSGVGMARAPSLSAKFAPPSATLSSTVAPRLSSIGSGVGLGRAPTLSAKFAPAAATLSSTVAPRLASSVGTGFSMARAPQLQGVDLRLDQFDLSEATRITTEGVPKPLEECVAMGPAFFDCLDGSKQLLGEEDQALLKSVFSPVLSDRRSEGDLFVPPNPSASYLRKLRALVKDEESVRARRKEAFLSTDFSRSTPGSLFPLSWKPTFEVAAESKTQGAPKPCPEYLTQESTLKQLLKDSVPTFDKSTEEGMRFRIYKAGKLEVRTTQDFEGSEVIGAVFA